MGSIETGLTLAQVAKDVAEALGAHVGEQQPETIHEAAIKLADGRVISVPRPGRHPSVILLCQKEGWSLSESAQGFTTSKGRFVGRYEAHDIARVAGQLLPRAHGGVRLFSEDVW